MNAGSAFLWNDGTTTQMLTATMTGTYFVNVTNANGCSSVDSVDVVINPLPVVNLGADTAQCGGSVTFDAGNPGMDYNWYNSTTAQTLTIFSSDTVSVTVTNPLTGCISSDMVVVNIGQPPVVDLGSDTTQCAGIVTLDAGNTGATFMWSDLTTAQTLAVSTSGSYAVAVSNSFGCTAADTINVIINPLPVMGLLPFTSPECVQVSSINLTGGTPAGGVYSGTTVSGSTFSPTAAGVGVYVITYTVTDATTGCQNSSSQNILINDCTGITENELANGINVYPNPANGMVNIAVSNPDFSALTISVVDLQGKQVYSSVEKGITAGYNKQIDLNGFAKGIYYIKLSSDASMAIKKLIIQ